MRSLLASAVAAVSALVVFPTLAHAEPAPAAVNVVALGDSYASGTGAGAYQPGTEGSCWRSANSYPETVAGQLKAGGKQVNFTNVTCSGATTSDLTRPFKGQPPQLDALKPDTNVVTLSIGANDIDFAAYGGQCIQADCTGAATSSVLGRLPAMGGNVHRLLEDVKARSPRATIVLAGYGRQLTMGANAPNTPHDPICGPQVFTEQERLEGNVVASLLDLTLRGAAASAGQRVGYVSPYIDSFHLDPAFAGHSLCDAKPPYYRGFDALAPGQEGQEAVLHLNAGGQAALAGLVLPKIPR